MNLPAFDLVIFDCDGTLVDTELLHNTATSRVLIEAGFPQYTVEYSLKNFMGLNQKKILALVEQETGTKLPPDILSGYIDVVLQGLKNGMQPAPGAKDILDLLKQRGVRMCVASNGEAVLVRASLTAAGLIDYFGDNAVFTAGQVARPKPSPDLFLFAAKEMGCDPARTLVIEDSVTGVRAGVSAGMATVGYVGLAHDPVRQRPALEEAGADPVIGHYSDLENILFIC